MEPNDSVPDGAGLCGHCGGPLEPSSTIPLWDGRDYCRRCVEGLCPELGSYAAEHPELAERMPHSAWRVAWQYLLLVELVALPLFGGVFFAAGMSEAGGMKGIVGGLVGLLMSQIIILPVGLLYATATGVFVALRRPGVSVRGGRLTVTGGSALAGVYDLAGCGWFVGKTCQMILGQKLIAPFLDRAILLAPSDAVENRERFIAVGFSEESRRRWEAFLTLAGAPRWTAREHGENTLLSALRGVVGILMVFPGSFFGCLYLGRAVTWVLTALLGNQDVASAVGFFCFVPGTVYAALYVMIFWPWSRVKRSKAKRLTAEEVRKVRLAQVCLALGIGCMITLSVLLFDRVGVTWKVIYLSLVYTSLAWVAYDLVPRAFAIRWATTETEPEER